MNFGEKLRKTRLSLNISQSELSSMTGISERSLYSYEQSGIIPRGNNVKKLADALNVSVSFLLNDTDSIDNTSDNEAFISAAKSEYGYKGAREAREILLRTSALFAGGDLNDEDKELFFESLMEVYLNSKQEAREKFSQKKRASKTKSDL